MTTDRPTVLDNIDLRRAKMDLAFARFGEPLQVAVDALDAAMDWPDYDTDRDQLWADMRILVEHDQSIWAIRLYLQHIDRDMREAQRHVYQLEHEAGRRTAEQLQTALERLDAPEPDPEPDPWWRRLLGAHR